jgi:hypothetical protein
MIPPCRLLIVLLILLFFAGNTTSVKAQATRAPYRLQISYFGVNATRPGLKAGIETPLIHRAYNNAGSITSREQTLYLMPALGGWYHHGNTTNLFAGLELGYRYTWSRGFMLEAQAGTALLRSFRHGTTYYIDPDGQQQSKQLAGSTHVLNILSLGAGKRIGSTLLFIRPGIMHKYPAHSHSNYGFSLQAGASIMI